MIKSLPSPLRSSSPPSPWSTSTPSARSTWPTVSGPPAGGRSPCTRVRSTRSRGGPTWTSSSLCSWGAFSRLNTGRCEAPRCSATASDALTSHFVVPPDRQDLFSSFIPLNTQHVYPAGYFPNPLSLFRFWVSLC